MDKTYYSAIDWWLAAILILSTLIAPAIFIVPGILIKKARTILISTGMIAGIIEFAILAALLIPCSYTLTQNSLKVRCGIVINSTIPLIAIHNAQKTNNPLSAPALSLNRIAITGANGKLLVLISPKDRDAFIADLKSRLAMP